MQNFFWHFDGFIYSTAYTYYSETEPGKFVALRHYNQTPTLNPLSWFFSFTVPDEPFHNFWDWRSRDQWILCSSGTSCDGFFKLQNCERVCRALATGKTPKQLLLSSASFLLNQFIKRFLFFSHTLFNFNKKSRATFLHVLLLYTSDWTLSLASETAEMSGQVIELTVPAACVYLCDSLWPNFLVKHSLTQHKCVSV